MVAREREAWRSEYKRRWGGGGHRKRPLVVAVPCGTGTAGPARIMSCWACSACSCLLVFTLLSLLSLSSFSLSSFSLSPFSLSLHSLSSFSLSPLFCGASDNLRTTRRRTALYAGRVTGGSREGHGEPVSSSAALSTRRPSRAGCNWSEGRRRRRGCVRQAGWGGGGRGRVSEGCWHWQVAGDCGILRYLRVRD